MSIKVYKDGKLQQVAGNTNTKFTRDDLIDILRYTPADSSVCEETFKQYLPLAGGEMDADASIKFTRSGDDTYSELLGGSMCHYLPSSGSYAGGLAWYKKIDETTTTNAASIGYFTNSANGYIYIGTKFDDFTMQINPTTKVTTLTGDLKGTKIIPSVALDTESVLGDNDNPWYQFSGSRVILKGDTSGQSYGALYVNNIGTSNTEGLSIIRVGNAIAAGKENNAKGKIEMYGNSTYYATILPGTMKYNISLTLPSSSGTLGLAPYKQTIDLSDTSVYDPNTWYPCTGTGIPSEGFQRIKVAVQLNSGTKPSWSTHAGGFSCVLDLETKAHGWGATNGCSIVYDSSYNYTTSMPIAYSQMTNSSTPVLWCRGGGKYPVATTYNAKWTPRTSTYTTSSQTVGPTTTAPSTSITRSTIHANLSGNSSTTTKLQTSRTLTIGSTGKAFNGTANVSWSLSEIGAAAASHTHSYLPLSGGTLTGALTGVSYVISGYNSTGIYNGGNDYAGLAKYNNLNIKSWYGVSFSTSCTGYACSTVPAVSIDCRNGNLFTYGYVKTTKLLPKTALSTDASVGTDASPWYEFKGTRFLLRGDTSGQSYGSFYIESSGTTSTVGVSTVRIGNSLTSGKANNSKGQLDIYGTGAYYTRVVTGSNTANVTLTLPTSTGTLALAPIHTTTTFGPIPANGELLVEIPCPAEGYRLLSYMVHQNGFAAISHKLRSYDGTNKKWTVSLWNHAAAATSQGTIHGDWVLG